MATGYGITGKGKHNNAGEEIQDIDWDSIPPDKRGMAMGQPQPKMKADALLAEPDPFNESQLPTEADASQLVTGDEKQTFYDDDCQLPANERKKVAGGTDAEVFADGELQGGGGSDSQVKDRKKVKDPTGGVKVKKVPLPGRK
jgi:hypothetical protein